MRRRRLGRLEPARRARHPVGARAHSEIDPTVEWCTEGSAPKKYDMQAPDQTSFLVGGPFVDLQSRIHRRRPSWSQAYTALAFILLTWAPVAVLATLGGMAQSRAFLLDGATQLRLLVVGPIAILVEPLVGLVLGRTAQNFLDAGIVQGEQAGRFDLVIRGVKRLRDSVGAEMVLLAAAYLITAWISVSETTIVPEMRGWSTRSSPAWIWYAWVSRPLLHFLLLRWLWRIVIWAVFLFRTSRLQLRLSAAHPDRAGGLGFLTVAHSTLALVAFPFAILWAAGFGESFVHGRMTASELKPMLAIFVLLVAAVFVGPLLVFTPKLVMLRQRALISYGRLSNEYCWQFERRWISREPRPTPPGVPQRLAAAPTGDESLLGSADIQSLADLQNSVGAVRAARPIPIDRTLVASLLVATLLPVLPLLLLILPLTELLKRALSPFL
jgi:hypothetical protein